MSAYKKLAGATAGMGRGDGLDDEELALMVDPIALPQVRHVGLEASCPEPAQALQRRSSDHLATEVQGGEAATFFCHGPQF